MITTYIQESPFLLIVPVGHVMYYTWNTHTNHIFYHVTSLTELLTYWNLLCSISRLWHHTLSRVIDTRSIVDLTFNKIIWFYVEFLFE